MSRLAHPSKRFQGQFIDGLITLILFAISLFLFQPLALDSRYTDLLIIIVPCSYYLFSDALPNGQSIAKRLLGMATVDQTTLKPCRLWQSFARNIVIPIFGILDAMLIFSQYRKRSGDYLANTIVIVLEKNNS